MCNRFIEDFAEKVIEKSVFCESCNNRRKNCKQLDDEYNHMNKELLLNILHGDTMCDMPKRIRKDIVLSFLHNKMFTKKNLEMFIYNIVDSPKIKVKKHNCFSIPFYIIVLDYDIHQTSVRVYNNLEEYYKTLEDDVNYVKERSVLSLKEWLDKNLYE